MPQLDLTTLSGPELRQLLDSARSRGHAAQSYEILQEMARRRQQDGAAETRKRRFGGRRRIAHAPHIIDLDLGDPLDPQPEPWEVGDLPEAPHDALGLTPLEEDDGFLQPPPPPAEAAPDDEPPLTLTREPGSAAAAPRSAPKALRPAKAARPTAPPKTSKTAKAPRPARRPGSALGFALGGLAGIVLGVGVGGSLREALALPQEPEEPPPMTVAEAPPPPPIAPEPALVAATEIPAEPQLAETAIEAPEALAAGEDAAATLASPEATSEPPKPEPQAEPKAQLADGCAAEPTPADRAICGDAGLQKLQKDLRHAYAEALAAHADRDLLRRRQLAWREARNDVSDTTRLAMLYEARIRKLNAATADARSRR
ncbi:hypothetical protein LRS10_03210 [Phenylobacterium sp. J426]|uniref:hypothetical protein n=1 Tax=Phenylobacterium sp. J426 TaxID=2898439 RepID=UPI002150E247|nr:hypothetical protein [Phenylobacterium sp. J426]MCR5873286.1 hypothetical protein [Phenylobacterium sp. J426]